MISVVVPCYNEETALLYFYPEIKKVMDRMSGVPFEVLLIDDGSKDSTLEVMRNLAAKDHRVYYIAFSRNFGKEAAIYAGLKNAKGDYVAIMDADLQDPPALLPDMYEIVTKEGYDSVATRRVTRKGEPPIRSFFARMFYKLMKRISRVEMVDGARDYRLMNRRFVDALLQMGEYNRFAKGMFGWVGFQTKWLEFENRERVAGETKWSFWGLFKYSIDGIVAFSSFPLALSSCFGLISCLVSFVFLFLGIIRSSCFGSLMHEYFPVISVVLFLGGIQLLGLGILGKYLSNTYMETKKRPIYLARETNRRKEEH